MRDRVCGEIKLLEDSPPETFLNAAVDCHLRMSSNQKKSKKSCKLCQVHEDIEVYEGMIFHFVREAKKALGKGKARETITTDDAMKLEEKGVFLLQEQRKGEKRLLTVAASQR